MQNKNSNINNYFFGGLFRTAFLFIILAELFSFWGYFLPAFNKIAFFVIIILALILSLQKLEYGVYIILAELFIGSKGYLFFFEHSGFVVSIRIALWLIVMAVWVGEVISGLNRRGSVSLKEAEPLRFFRSVYFKYFFSLFIFIIWGVINGFLNHNEFSNIFFDFNNWLYFLLVFPVYYILKSPSPPLIKGGFFQNIMQVFAAAIIWLCFKTFILLFLFSHFSPEAIYDIYRWVRVSGVGEITNLQDGFYRIFFQSHIFVLVGFFIFLAIIAINDKITNPKRQIPIPSTRDKIQSRVLGTKFKIQFSVLASLLAVIIITFSRSFWVGFIFGVIIIYAYLIWQKIQWKKILEFSGILATRVITSFILIFAIVKFPYPASTADFSASLLSERAGDISEGAAVSSRWNLLPELWKEIKKAPVLGKGFGATVTYISGDPRVLETNLTGEYTTYAFEWGWLDIWLKLGLFGLLTYLVLIGKIIYNGIKLNYELRITNYEFLIITGLTIGLVVVAVVSIFSPYMNHPLGIGYLILISALLSANKKEIAQNLLGD